MGIRVNRGGYYYSETDSSLKRISLAVGGYNDFVGVGYGRLNGLFGTNYRLYVLLTRRFRASVSASLKLPSYNDNYLYRPGKSNYFDIDLQCLFRKYNNHNHFYPYGLSGINYEKYMVGKEAPLYFLNLNFGLGSEYNFKNFGIYTEIKSVVFPNDGWIDIFFMAGIKTDWDMSKKYKMKRG